MRQRTGAIVCPRCERLIAASEKRCPHCGNWQPGMFGYGPALNRWLGGAVDLTNAITLTCAALYVLSLALDPMAIFQMRGGIFGLLSPSGDALFKLGMTGGYQLVSGQWWTLATAVFLHGGVLHILFNMAVMRQYLPNVEHLFGPVRAFLIFMIAGIAGFALSVGAGFFFGMHNTVGASGAIFGLLGALIAYGRKTHQSFITNQLWGSAIMMFVMGFLMQGVDNFAHAGGFAGGYLCAMVMPTAGRREQAGELALAGVLTVVTLAGFVLSLFGYAPFAMR